MASQGPRERWARQAWMGHQTRGKVPSKTGPPEGPVFRARLNGSPGGVNSFSCPFFRIWMHKTTNENLTSRPELRSPQHPCSEGLGIC